MPGFTFLFSAALWALPMAGLPVLLHLLFRRKGPVVPFSTLRFVRTSVQHTAARRMFRRWLLLACRVALLAALVGAVAQPVVKPAFAGASGGHAVAAVIVVDTSYSMQLQDSASTLLARADRTVRDLLGGPLRGARVAILRSAAIPPDQAELEELRRQERFRDAGEIKWSALRPQAARQPLVDRIGIAAEMLDKEPADEKWLVVVSDLQRREFPRAITASKSMHTALIDLHPAAPRNVAVTRVATQPQQLIAGLGGEATVDVVGSAGDLRQVNLSASGLRGEGTKLLPPQPARLDDSGHGQVTFPLNPPAGEWLRLEASLATPQPLAWGQARVQLLRLPPRQVVALLPASQLEAARTRLGWALDPSEGQAPAWPLVVRAVNDLPADADVAAMLLTDWPDAERGNRLLDFVRRGKTLIWFVRPGLEQTWEKLPAAQKTPLAALLPGRPDAGARVPDLSAAAIAAPGDAALAGLTDDKFQIGTMSVRRLIPFEAIDPKAAALLTASPAAPDSGPASRGLVYRKSVGAGTVFTFATLPDKHYSTLQLHPIFPPMLVQMALRPANRSDAGNVEIGDPLIVSAPKFDRLDEVRVQGPDGAVESVKPTTHAGVRQFIFTRADEPGLYVWKSAVDDAILAVTNVQFPAAEAELQYTAADSVVTGTGGMIVHSAHELNDKFALLAEPQPRWAVPLGIVLVLLCVEAFVGTRSGRGTPARLGSV